MLEVAAKMFEPKGEARLLQGLPQHRRAAGCEAFLEPIPAGEEVIDADAALVSCNGPERAK
jgi:hypothetical protein